MSSPLRYAAFTDTPEGGNPAGVVLDASGLSDAQMQAIAAEVGFSETAFLTPRPDGDYDVRYFAPRMEVAFCGHATIAAGVAIAEREGPGRRVFHTRAGAVPVETEGGSGDVTAALTSVPPHSEEIPDDALAAVLDTLGWTEDELDPQLPPRIGYGGARHLILAAARRERLAALDYDFDALAQLMHAHDLTTVDLIHRRGELTFDARNPFPVGGVVEDPATGAAAAAFGGYLRELGLVTPPATVTIHQGDDMGRPSVLIVDIPADGGIRVSGRAAAM